MLRNYIFLRWAEFGKAAYSKLSPKTHYRIQILEYDGTLIEVKYHIDCSFVHLTTHQLHVLYCIK
jgi:hypothetical protein